VASGVGEAQLAIRQARQMMQMSLFNRVHIVAGYLAKPLRLRRRAGVGRDGRAVRDVAQLIAGHVMHILPLMTFG